MNSPSSESTDGSAGTVMRNPAIGFGRFAKSRTKFRQERLLAHPLGSGELTELTDGFQLR